MQYAILQYAIFSHFMEGEIMNKEFTYNQCSTPCIHSASSGVQINGHFDTWYVIDSIKLENIPLFLMESERFGDEAAQVIVDATGKVVMEDIWNGFQEPGLEECMKEYKKNIVPQTFEVGKRYFDTHANNHESISVIEIVKRTNKTVTFRKDGKERRTKIHKDKQGEFLIPDNYSMGCVYRPSREYKKTIQVKPAKKAGITHR